MGYVLVAELLSRRLRRRDDVAVALGAPVRLSVGPLRRRRWRLALPWRAAKRKHDMNRVVILGWIIFLSGSAIWLYGYCVTGHPSIINWHARTPWWIADFMPNLESELGMLLCIVGMVPMYWPASQSKPRA